MVLVSSMFAHVLSDFVFQNNYIIKKKESLEFKGFILHGSIIFFFQYFLLALQYSFVSSLLFSSLVTLLHLFFDWIKYRFFSNINAFFDFSYFFIDQFLHISTIIIMTFLLVLNKNYILYRFYCNVYILMQKSNFFISNINLKNIFITLIIYIYFCLGGTIVINKFLEFSMPRHSGNIIRPTTRTGEYIGIFERALIITLVINNLPSTIGLVIAAKSIARFNELNKQFPAEYYLLGTLFSVFLGTLGGLLLSFLL